MPMLRIDISGLCYFAFDQSLKAAIDGTGPLPKRVDLLMQRLYRAEKLVHENQVLDQHFPLLEFELDDLSPSSTREPNYLFQWDTSSRSMKQGGCLLVGDDMTILLDGQPLGTRGLTLSVHKPAVTSDLKTLWWMPTLEHAFPRIGPIDPIHLATLPTNTSNIAARLPLTEGTLRTGELSDRECVFVHGAADFKRKISTHLHFEVPFTSKVEIALVNRRDNAITQSNLAFSPRGGADLELKLKNAEIDGSIGLKDRYGIRAEADFEIYTRLLPEARRLQIHSAALLAEGSGNSAGVAMGACPPGS